MERCKTCGRKKVRTTRANRRYFALVAQCVTFVFNGQRWSKKQWHEMFKDMFIQPLVIDLPNGKRAVRDPESSDLDGDDFSEFMDKVESWCAERGIFLPEETL